MNLFIQYGFRTLGDNHSIFNVYCLLFYPYKHWLFLFSILMLYYIILYMCRDCLFSLTKDITVCEYVILLTIFANCVALAINTPFPGEDSNEINQILVSYLWLTCTVYKYIDVSSYKLKHRLKTCRHFSYSWLKTRRSKSPSSSTYAWKKGRLFCTTNAAHNLPATEITTIAQIIPTKVRSTLPSRFLLIIPTKAGSNGMKKEMLYSRKSPVINTKDCYSHTLLDTALQNPIFLNLYLDLGSQTKLNCSR